MSEERPDGPVYVQGDQVGSPNILTNASGAVVGRSKNLPFGERFGSAGYRSNRRYTNHEETEDYAIYMQARTYLPAYGKFAQVDPAYDQTKDDPESWNLYNYVTNNPITHTDPDGRETEKKKEQQESGKKDEEKKDPKSQEEIQEWLRTGEWPSVETFSVYYDKGLEKQTDGKTVLPRFIIAQLDAAKKLAASQGVIAQFNLYGVMGLEKAIRSQSGTNGVGEYLIDWYASRSENKNANGMIFLLRPGALQAATGSPDGKGYHRRATDGFSLIVGGTNVRATSHELLHRFGIGTDRWQHDIPILNEIHNWRFNRIMDRLGIPEKEYQSDQY